MPRAIRSKRTLSTILRPKRTKKDKKGADGKKGKKGKRGREKASGGGDGTSENKEDSDYKELGWDNDEVWSVDTSESAVAKRKEEEMATLANKARANKNVANSEGAKESKPKKTKVLEDNSPAQILRNYIAATERSHSEILDEIKRISLAREFDQKKKLQMTIDALCKLDTLDNFVDGMTKYKEILATFAENENDAKVFMGVFEEFVCRRNKEQFEDKVYKLLLALYDNDIVDEEDLLKWDALPHDKAVIVDQDEAQQIREKAAPFIKWLKESEEDDSDDDDDDDGEEEEDAD